MSTFGEWPEGSGVEALRIEASQIATIPDETIAYWKDGDSSRAWWIYLPGCGAGNLPNHKIEEHEDGTITVSPSIRMTGHKDGKPMERHGFLVRGRWHEV